MTLRRALFAVTLSVASMLFAPSLSAQVAVIPETKAQRDARMQWWREARFGMFIHWGVYSVPAGVHKGRPVAGIGEWIMKEGKIPRSEYEEYAKQFNPQKFDAEAWVKLAKASGMKYIVITAKHHDGFCMWDSKAGKTEGETIVRWFGSYR